MQARVREAFDNDFPDAAEMRTSTQSGRYDLCDETDTIFLPKVWSSMIGDYEESGLTIQIKPWILSESKIQENQVVPILESQGSEKDESVCTDMSQSDVEEARRPAHTETDDESAAESREDSAHSFIDDNFHWRLNFLQKFNDYDERFQEIWEREMRRSQTKAENTMLGILLNESNAKLKETDTSLNCMDDAAHSNSGPFTPDASARPRLNDIRETTTDHTTDHEDDDPTRLRQNCDSASIHSTVESDGRLNHTTRQELHNPHRERLEPLREQHETLGEQPRIIRSVELGASLRALQDANRRAESAVAKVEYLERKLSRLGAVEAGQSVHTPPDTPSVSSSPFSPPLPLAPGASHTMGTSSDQQERSVRSGSISSFRKKFFGRLKSSSGATA